MEKIEFLILKCLINNEDYSRKVLPFIKSEYFEDNSEKTVFLEIQSFMEQYNQLPTKEVLHIELDKNTNLTDETFKQSREIIQGLDNVEVEYQWLVDSTEKWCRDRAIYLALMDSIQIADGQDEKKNRDAIPSILSDALAVSFDNNIGHDYLFNYEEIPPKTLNIALAGTGVGKSLFMCHVASSVLLQGWNVLYITMEMAEEKIAERIDANLLNVPIQEITDLPKVMFENKVTNIAKKTQGSLIIKEYPTASAHSGHFKALLNELALKKSFRPDIIFIDYLNICASSRYRANGNVNSYSYIKSIAEELRGLAVEANVPIISATQTTRSGYASSDVDLTDTSESFGLPATADLMFALISTDELQELGQIMVKQLKNRYNDLSVYKRFILGIDRAKMRLYDCEQSQQNIIDGGLDEEENQFSPKDKFAKLSF